MPWPTKKLGEVIRRKAFHLLMAGLILNLFGSAILVFGALPSDEEIYQISGTYFGHNKFLIENLQQNRDLAEVGLIFLFFGFACEIFGTWGIRNKSQ